MTPLSFEWQWNIGYVIFMGLLYIALGIIGCGLIYTYVKTWFDMEAPDDQHSEIAYRSKYSEY